MNKNKYIMEILDSVVFYLRQIKHIDSNKIKLDLFSLIEPKTFAIVPKGTQKRKIATNKELKIDDFFHWELDKNDDSSSRIMAKGYLIKDIYEAVSSVFYKNEKAFEDADHEECILLLNDIRSHIESNQSQFYPIKIDSIDLL